MTFLLILSFIFLPDYCTIFNLDPPSLSLFPDPAKETGITKKRSQQMPTPFGLS